MRGGSAVSDRLTDNNTLNVLTYRRIMPGMRTKLTLHVEETLIEQIKIQAVREKRTVSDITEELYREFLKLAAKRKGEKHGR